MASTEQIKEYMVAYEAATGTPTDKLVCPLSFRGCEPSEIARGHIINDAIPYAFNKKVLDWDAVDNFYGTRTETTFIAFATSGLKTRTDYMRSVKGFKVQLKPSGEWFDAFLVEARQRENVESKMPVIVGDFDGEPLVIGIRTAKDDPDLPLGKVTHLEFKVSSTHLASHWNASMLKAAYLAVYDLMSYRGVMNRHLQPLRRTLMSYFEDNASRDDAYKYFGDYDGCCNVVGQGTDFAPKAPYAAIDFDSLRDRRVLRHYCEGRPYALSVFFKLPHVALSVTIPHAEESDSEAAIQGLYRDRLSDNPSLHHRAVLATPYEGTWVYSGEVNLHYQPPFEKLEVRYPLP